MKFFALLIFTGTLSRQLVLSALTRIQRQVSASARSDPQPVLEGLNDNDDDVLLRGVMQTTQEGEQAVPMFELQLVLKYKVGIVTLGRVVVC